VHAGRHRAKGRRDGEQRGLEVVGSRGHGEIAGLLLDSVSNALVHAAGCPVVIVRSGD